ncbi:mucin-2-like [Triticum aestivum]|uniref:mucin-2-like n=1 Tax=Triticum aestivum TaxID=4565 RepID=UPI001D0132DD|nr:mucin-2-like [Triticum aestivum]XP_044426297.1 mucin-2-like [Triticum aestivum]
MPLLPVVTTAPMTTVGAPTLPGPITTAGSPSPPAPVTSAPPTTTVFTPKQVTSTFAGSRDVRPGTLPVPSRAVSTASGCADRRLRPPRATVAVPRHACKRRATAAAVPGGAPQRPATAAAAASSASSRGSSMAAVANSVPRSTHRAFPPSTTDAATTGATSAQLGGVLAGRPADPSGPVPALPVATTNLAAGSSPSPVYTTAPERITPFPQFDGPFGSAGHYPDYSDQAPPASLFRTSEPVRHGAPTQTPPRFAKIDFATYDGTEDPLNWLNQCDQFFHGQRTLAPERTLVASYHLRGAAQTWYYALGQDEGRMPPWERFRELCLLRFGPSILGSFLAELSRLPFTSTVQDFVDRFQALACHASGVTMQQRADLFVGGLPDHIRVDVELRGPQDLQTAMYYARLRVSRPGHAVGSPGSRRPTGRLAAPCAGPATPDRPDDYPPGRDAALPSSLSGGADGAAAPGPLL